MTTLLAFLFVLGVLVFVHELGHFLVARWHGVRVITFSLGFGPKIVKVTRGGTEYCISIIPLGGYVKLAGENALEETAGPPAPDEFMAKSKWVRFQVYIAGPVMNIALALLVTTVVLLGGADEPLYKQAPAVIGWVVSGGPADKAGLRAGDRVLNVDGRDIATWNDLELAVLPKGGRQIVLAVTRDGAPLTITVTPEARGEYEMGLLGIAAMTRQKIAQVFPGTPAETAGFKHADILVGINGEKLFASEQFRERIRASAGTPLVFNLERAGAPLDVTVTPRGTAGEATIGISFNPHGESRRIDPTLWQAAKMSVTENWDHSKLIGQSLGGLFTRETPVRQLMGPVGIAQLSGSAAEVGWAALFGFMAMLSLNLGLLNLLPVPVLDGGHIAILAVEGIARRDLSVRVKERILMTGASLVVLLMVTVIYNDIARLLR